MPASLNDVISISASTDGSVWAVTKSQQVHKYDSAADAWQAMPGTLKQIAVGSKSNIWGVGADGKVWKWNSGANPWTAISSPEPGGLVQVSASSDGQAAWGVDADGKVWRNLDAGEKWEHIPASKATWVAAGGGGNVFSVDVIKQVWRYHQGGAPLPWIPGDEHTVDMVQISTRGHIMPSGPILVEAWGVNSHGDVLKFAAPFYWQKMGSGFKQIALGGDANIWGIDTNDVAVRWTPAVSIMELPEVPESWVDSDSGSRAKRWDSKDRYDQFRSTHLWIVSRAAEVAKADNLFGKQIFNLVQPGAERGQNTFHDALAEGLWDADEADPYRNVYFDGKAWSATYKSHFYDPTTGKNWRDEKEPTALTEASKFFAEAVKQYKDGNVRAAGYNFGLSLHYLTDMTQPMHASNYTALSSRPPKFHTAFERYAIEVMKGVHITQPYVHSQLGTDPAAYVKAIAKKSRPRAEKITTKDIVQEWGDGFTEEWQRAVKPEIEAALIDGVAITAQYLIAWMEAAQRTVPDTDLRLFKEAYGGAKDGYWALDQDGHLFRRLGWSFGWRLINTPKDMRAVSIWPESDGGLYAVTTDGVQYLDPNEKWERVYPPPLVDERPLPEIQQLAVVGRTSLWALDRNGFVHQGDGRLPEATWADTRSPALTSISSSDADSVWGVNAKNHSVWEYSGGNWQLRGEDLIQVSVDLEGKAWGISKEGRVVRYDGSSWQEPPEFSDTVGDHQTPGWGPLVWISARGPFVVIDHQGVAWAPSGVTAQDENPWMPLG